MPAVLKLPPPRPTGTPDNLWLSWQAARPTPIDQADLCIPVKAQRRKRPEAGNRLVVIGDSLSHGFKNYAISDTAHSWPAIVAYEMGWLDSFRRPRYDGPDGCPGLPLNLNELINRLETAGSKKPFFWNPTFLFRLRRILAQVRDYWDSGPGSLPPDPSEVPHNLAIYGWDLRDSLSKDYEWCKEKLAEPVSRGVFGSLFPRVSHDNERAALRVLKGDGKASYTQLSAAKALAEQAGVHFVGRLATYKYYNMDQVVAQALTLYARLCNLTRSEATNLECEPVLTRATFPGIVRPRRASSSARHPELATAD